MLSTNGSATPFSPSTPDGTLAQSAPLGQSGQSARPCPACDGRGGYEASTIVRGPCYTEEVSYTHGIGRFVPCEVCTSPHAMAPDVPVPGRDATPAEWQAYDAACWAARVAAGEFGPAITPDPLPDDWQAFRGKTVRDRNGDRMVWRENGIRTGYYPAGSVAA